MSIRIQNMGRKDIQLHLDPEAPGETSLLLGLGCYPAADQAALPDSVAELDQIEGLRRIGLIQITKELIPVVKAAKAVTPAVAPEQGAKTKE